MIAESIGREIQPVMQPFDTGWHKKRTKVRWTFLLLEKAWWNIDSAVVSVTAALVFIKEVASGSFTVYSLMISNPHGKKKNPYTLAIWPKYVLPKTLLYSFVCSHLATTCCRLPWAACRGRQACGAFNSPGDKLKWCSMLQKTGCWRWEYFLCT